MLVYFEKLCSCIHFFFGNSQHLREIQETYLEHASHSFHYMRISLQAAFYFCLHAFIPDVYITNGRNAIKSILDDIEKRTKQKEN